MPRTKGARDKTKRMPLGYFANCGNCRRRRGCVNLMYCNKCEREICNDCWIILNPDPTITKLGQVKGEELFCQAFTKIADPKAKEILWGCPICKTVIIEEPVDYIHDDLIAKLK